jgi:hypothetical protein
MGPNPLLHLQSNSKIQIFGQGIIVAATGAVGLAQRLSHHVEQAIAGGVFSNLNRNECITNITRRFLTDLSNTMVQNHPQLGLGFGALLATAIKGNACLVEYATTTFQPEVKEGKMFFVSIGSGQVLADPFLAFVSRVLWKEEMPTVDEARLGVYWVLNHTIRLAPGGIGGPIRIAVLRKNNSKWIAEEILDTQEPAQYINELERHIGNFARATIEEAPSTPPPAPPTA